MKKPVKPDKIPPFCEKDEQSLLGTMMFPPDNERWIEYAIQQGCVPSWFYVRDNEEICAVIFEMFGKGKPVSALSVSEVLRERDASKRWLEHATKCIDTAPTSAYFEYGLKRVKRSYHLRRSIQICDNSISKLRDCEVDEAESCIAGIQQSICSIEMTERNEQDPAEVAIEQVKIWKTTQVDERVGVNWFLPRLNNNLGNITDELIILAALPSVGKTAFALNQAICSAWATKRVSFASLESPAKRISERITSIICGTNAQSMKFRRVLPERYDEAQSKLEEFKRKASAFIGWNFSARSIEQLTAWGRSEVSNGSRLIIIDNMRHIISSSRKSKVEEMSELSSAVKIMRDRLGVAVLCLHHLSDELKLKWSRDINADADIISTLTVDEEGVQTQDRSDVLFRIEKNRDGPAPLKARLRFERNIQTFEEV